MLFLLFSSVLAVQAQDVQKSRVIILTDVENEPDDSQSLVRLVLYSNVIDIKGIIATTSVHMKNEVHPETIRKVILAYEKVQPNLLKHEADFPDAASLLNIVKEGIPEYGMGGVGEGKDSEGSEWIIKVLDEDDSRPLWVCAWGGPNTLAQALFKIRKTRPASEASGLIKKLRVYTISDQDDSGNWMRKNFPDLFYIVSPGGYDTSTWGAINQFFPGIDNETVSNSWLAKNIQQDHGPLGEVYPDVAYGMEGDTPSFLGLIPNGLNYPEHPEWGGWGGRYELYKPEYNSLNTKGFTGGVPVEPEPRPIWTNANDRYTPYIFSEYGQATRRDTITFFNNKATLFRWREEFQNDFAARIDWCTKPYREANHPPVPVLVQPDQITVRSGDIFTLRASGSTDPDNDNLSYLWIQYPEAGTYKKPVRFSQVENIYRVIITAPVVEKKETVHFILRVTDKGDPPLTRYKRIIVNILPGKLSDKK
ncbi:MAG: DUF1593 domain-containing protein [Bacteroidales bacterium]|nr:DUF1593 domain-containing protein [Bacteroidales bacterium]